MANSHLSSIDFDKGNDRVKVVVRLGEEITDSIALIFSGVKRVTWQYEYTDDLISGMRLTIDDTYLLTHFDGADIEILSAELTID